MYNKQMSQSADIAAFDKNGQLALLAEVKNKRGTSREWANEMRRSIYEHARLPNAPYFLLALPDKFYLWQGTNGSSEAAPPMLEVDPTPFLRPYYQRLGTSVLTGESFELLVAAWLNRVLIARSPEDLDSDNESWLVASGVFDRLAGGHLELETAA
jgi:hypothetical protein